MQCKICNKKSNHLENHHIIPISRGGDDSESNLIKICTKCHSLAHDVSFTNERGGLIKEAHERRNLNYKIALEWFNNEQNEKLFDKKMELFYNKDEDKHMLFLLLIENNKITLYDMMQWTMGKKINFKTSFTF